MPPAQRTEGKAAKPTQEQKAEKFVELARKRMGTALDSIARVGKLASTRTYHFTPEQVERIDSALKQAVQAVRDKYDAALAAPEASPSRTKTEWDFS